MNDKKGLDPQILLNVFLIFTVVIATRGLIVDFENTCNSGGVDLRNRAVGARLMLEGLDPYYFKWNTRYPDTLLDPLDNPYNPVSRVSVPPSVLMLHVPMAKLRYSTQRFLWLVLQWLFLLLSLQLLASRTATAWRKKAIWSIGLLMAALPLWRFHVERGQIYIVYVFLLSLSYWLCRKSTGRSSFLGGLVLGITVALRPTMILLGIPFIFQRKKEILSGLISGMLVFLLITMAFFGISIWKSYLTAMPYHEKANLGEISLDASNPEYPPIIDGMDNLNNAMGVPYHNSSLQYLVYYFLNVRLPSWSMIVFTLIVVALSCIYFLRRKDSILTLSALFLSGSVLVLVSDYFLPAIKSFYMEILWLIPACMSIIEWDNLARVESRRLCAAFFFLFSGIFFNTVLIWYQHCLMLSDFMIVVFFALISFLANEAQKCWIAEPFKEACIDR